MTKLSKFAYVQKMVSLNVYKSVYFNETPLLKKHPIATQFSKRPLSDKLEKQFLMHLLEIIRQSY